MINERFNSTGSVFPNSHHGLEMNCVPLEETVEPLTFILSPHRLFHTSTLFPLFWVQRCRKDPEFWEKPRRQTRNPESQTHFHASSSCPHCLQWARSLFQGSVIGRIKNKPNRWGTCSQWTYILVEKIG